MLYLKANMRKKAPLKLSVVKITKNEEDRLERTLKPLKDWAGEIVVIDSGSTDKTVEIAKRYGAKVHYNEWKDYATQKNFGLKKTSFDWILFLDADEVISEELKKAIEKVIEQPTAEGYYLRRRTYYLGKLLKYVWAKEKVLRLVNKNSKPRWVGKVHERIELKGKKAYINEGFLYHYTYRNLKEQLDKTLKYAYLSALELHSKGKSFSIFKLIFSPLWNFIKLYFLQLGFLEGLRGFLIAIISSAGTFYKYALLWDLEREKKIKDSK